MIMVNVMSLVGIQVQSIIKVQNPDCNANIYQIAKLFIFINIKWDTETRAPRVTIVN